MERRGRIRRRWWWRWISSRESEGSGVIKASSVLLDSFIKMLLCLQVRVRDAPRLQLLVALREGGGERVGQLL